MASHESENITKGLKKEKNGIHRLKLLGFASAKLEEISHTSWGLCQP